MFGRIGGCFALIILLRQYNQSTMRRIGGDFPFCRVVVQIISNISRNPPITAEKNPHGQAARILKSLNYYSAAGVSSISESTPPVCSPAPSVAVASAVGRGVAEGRDTCPSI